MLPFIKLISYLQSCCSFNQNSCDVQHLIRSLLPPSLSVSSALSVCISAFGIVAYGTASSSLHARIHKKDNKCQSYMAPALPATDPFPSICLLGACLTIISNHILTFMPSKNRGNFPFVRHFLKRRHFTNFIKPNVIKMPQTTARRQ